MFAKDIMETNVITLKKNATIREIAELMITHGISGFPVVNEQNTVLGVVSELDLMRKEIRPNEPNAWTVCLWSFNNSNKLSEYQDAVRKYMANTAGDIMTSPAITVDEKADLETVGKLMFDNSIKRVFVTENGVLAGVISRSAFVKLLLANKKQ